MLKSKFSNPTQNIIQKKNSTIININPLTKIFKEVSEKLSKIRSETSDSRDSKKITEIILTKENHCNLLLNRCNQRALYVFRPRDLLKRRSLKYGTSKI